MLLGVGSKRAVYLQRRETARHQFSLGAQKKPAFIAGEISRERLPTDADRPASLAPTV
jgi:hypothetical protein